MVKKCHYIAKKKTITQQKINTNQDSSTSNFRHFEANLKKIHLQSTDFS